MSASRRLGNVSLFRRSGCEYIPAVFASALLCCIITNKLTTFLRGRVFFHRLCVLWVSERIYVLDNMLLFDFKQFTSVRNCYLQLGPPTRTCFSVLLYTEYAGWGHGRIKWTRGVGQSRDREDPIERRLSGNLPKRRPPAHDMFVAGVRYTRTSLQMPTVDRRVVCFPP